MRTGWLFGTAFAASVVVAVGCSSSSTANPYPDVASFCTALAQAECDKASGYCAVTASACTTARSSKCNALAAGTASTTPDTDPFAAVTGARKYTSGSASDCIDATKSVYASQAAITPAQFQAQQDKCNLVFQGAGATEAVCATSFDCSGSLICDKGVCATKSVVAAGQFCASPGQTCDDTSYCAADSSGNKKCLPKSAIGITCSPTLPCVTDAVCQNSACVAKFVAGTACTASSQCASSAPFCDPSVGSGKCDTGLLLGGGAKGCNAYGATN